MIKGEKDYLLNLAKDNVCSEHHLPLEVQWNEIEQENALYCVKGHYPAAIVRSMVEGHKVFDRQSPPLKTDSVLTQKTDLGTGALLDPITTQALEKYAKRYALDFYRDHVVLMYGKPYITLDGYLYHANRTNVKYQLKSHPLIKDERRAYQVPEGSYAWLAEIIKEGEASVFSGFGIVTKDEMEGKSTKNPEQLRSPVVAAHPWQLAQKRAEWQALRRAFPIGESTGT